MAARPLKNVTRLPPRKLVQPDRGSCDQQRGSWKLLGPHGCVQGKIRSPGTPGPMLGWAPPSPSRHCLLELGARVRTSGLSRRAEMVIFLTLPVRGLGWQTRARPSFQRPPEAHQDGVSERVSPPNAALILPGPFSCN